MNTPEATASAPLAAQVQAVWNPPGGGASQLVVWPERQEAAKRFLVSNDAAAVLALLAGTSLTNWYVVDARELHRLLFPEQPAEEAAAQEFPDVASLWAYWQRCGARLDALPVWAHELLSSTCTALGEDGLAALFSYWASTLDMPGTSRRWQDSFEPSVRRVERRALPRLEDCTPLDPDRVAAYLEEGGALSRLVPGYEPRPGQIQMLRAVAEAIGAGSHLVVEAGTGIGKSLAYLLPCALWAKLNDVPVVVSTNTKNLQTQLVEKDLPAVLRVIDEARAFPETPPLQAAVIKGRANYLCLRRFAQMLDGGLYELQRPEVRLFAATVIWAVTTTDGDFDALTGSGAVDPAFLQGLSSSSDECAGRGCRHYARCFVQKARERALRSNLVVANHSLVFAELGADQPVSLPPHAQIVFDEAHNLEEAATAFFTAELSPQAINALVRRLAQRRGKASRGVLFSLRRRLESGAVGAGREKEIGASIDEALSVVASLGESPQELFKALHGLVAENETPRRFAFAPVAPDEPPPAPDPPWRAAREAQARFRGDLAKLRRNLETIGGLLTEAAADELNLAAGDATDLSAAAARIEELERTAEMVLAGSDDSYVFWVQRARAPGALGEALAAPINVGEFLARKLYDRLSSVVLCSATLSVAGSFSYAASRLGLDLIPPERLRTCVAPSPFDYVGQCALLVPTYLPEPQAQDRSYVAELSDLVVRLAARYGGRTLVLFTSYEMMRQSADLVRDALADRGLALLVQGESGSRNRITRVFREGGGRVLYGTQSFWEGVDVVGDALSCVVVARLPFASPTDPVVSARCERIDAAGGHSFFEFSVPMAVLRLRQGFGRLIRHRLDRGTVVVADTRIVTKGYGRAFARSLPAPLRRCASADEVLASLK